MKDTLGNKCLDVFDFRQIGRLEFFLKYLFRYCFLFLILIIVLLRADCMEYAFSRSFYVGLFHHCPLIEKVLNESQLIPT